MKVTFWHNIVMLKSSQNINIEIEFIFSNWSYELKITTKKGLGIKLVVWLLTQNLGNRGKMTFNFKWSMKHNFGRSHWRLQLCVWNLVNQNSYEKVMNLQITRLIIYEFWNSHSKVLGILTISMQSSQ